MKLIGFFFLYLYVEFGVRIRSESRESNVLTEDAFRFEDVLTYAPDIKTIELTGNVSAPKLLQVLQYTGRMHNVMQPISLPSNGTRHASFIEAKYPETSATSQLAVAQVYMPHLSRKRVSQIVEQHSFYSWDILWYVKNGSVEVELDADQQIADQRFRAGAKLSKTLTALVLSAVEEQLITMLQTGLLRSHETSGMASLALANFVPASGLLPERYKISDGYHRDALNDKGRIEPSDMSVEMYETVYGPTLANQPQNSTMLRKSRFDQIISFTYEKGVAESRVRAYMMDGQNNTNVELIDQTDEGQSNTYMIDQSSKLQHVSRQIPISKDRRAIILNVMPL
jgi:hypothetical protein